MRTLLSYYLTVGVSAALGLLLSAAGGYLLDGPFAAAVAAVGAIVCIPPDNAAPLRGKFWHLLPAPLIGLPLFVGVQLLHAEPVYLGLLLIPATFFAFLAGAWGARGAPIVASIMFAMIFAMALPVRLGSGTMLTAALAFALGAGIYLLYATLANSLLNGRYRAQLLADVLLSLAELMRLQARLLLAADADGERTAPIGQLMRRQATLAEHLQAARDILLESPRTPRRQRLAAMLLRALDMRDHLLACGLDLDTLHAQPCHAAMLDELRGLLEAQAGEIERIADALLLGRRPARFETLRPRLGALRREEIAAAGVDPDSAILARGLADRIATMSDEVMRLNALARGEVQPDLTRVRTAWRMFVSPTAWSWLPFLALWRWDAPPLRHAIRAALAVGAAYALSFAMPWGTHDYWVLVTIVVVLRGNLAQTIERRNHRVAGTLIGCVLAGGVLALQVPTPLLLAIVAVAQALAHAFAARRYVITAVGATVVSLVLAHLLTAGANPAFDVLERLADTLIGVAIAWGFSYVLPTWERTQIPALVTRTLTAQARHARVALSLGQLRAVDDEPELEWRLARREAYDSLSSLVQATQRSLVEPRAVRPPLEPLSRLLAHGYQLLAQLTAAKTTLLLRRDRLDHERLAGPLQEAAQTIEDTLIGTAPAAATDAVRPVTAPGPVKLPDPFESDLSPWVLRRLDRAGAIAVSVREDADRVRLESSPAS